MADHVDSGGSSPVYLLWHIARHHDLAVNRVLRNGDEVLAGWMDHVHMTSDTWRGLGETEDLDLVRRLDAEAVGEYVTAVFDETIEWLTDSDLGAFDTTVDGSLALSEIGTPEDGFDWLYSIWKGRPRHYFLSWEAIGHGFSHLGELTSIRNRMGLNPF